jgi:hypothetical protein
MALPEARLMIDHYSYGDWYTVLMVFLNIFYVMYLYMEYLVIPFYEEFRSGQ